MRTRRVYDVRVAVCPRCERSEPLEREDPPALEAAS